MGHSQNTLHIKPPAHTCTHTTHTYTHPPHPPTHTHTCREGLYSSQEIRVRDSTVFHQAHSEYLCVCVCVCVCVFVCVGKEEVRRHQNGISWQKNDHLHSIIPSTQLKGTHTNTHHITEPAGHVVATTC